MNTISNPVLNQHNVHPASIPSAIDQLRAQMASGASSANAGWEQAWQEGITPWDKGQIQDALEDLFDQDGSEWGAESVRGGRALVAGCGKGYDVLFLSGKVKECWGMDISAKAIELAKNWAESQPEAKERSFSFHEDDFFGFQIPEGSFDLAYDYTFLCAIQPSQRPRWAERYHQLIKEGGKLITLIYPIDGDRPGGPPFSLDPEDVQALLTKVGFKKIYYRMPTRTRYPQREVMAVWERTSTSPQSTE